MRSKLNKNCQNFLAKDKEKFQENSFNSTKFLVSLLPGLSYNQLSASYEQYSNLENDVEDLVDGIIDQNIEKFNDLMGNPEIYAVNIRK